MSADKLTKTEAIRIGRTIKTAKTDNYLFGSFAAEIIGGSYPLNKKMQEILFKSWSDEDLGRRFAKWLDETGN